MFKLFRETLYKIELRPVNIKICCVLLQYCKQVHVVILTINEHLNSPHENIGFQQLKSRLSASWLDTFDKVPKILAVQFGLYDDVILKHM